METIMVTAQPKLGFWTLLAVAGRTFFLQACWNFQRMQNLGFAFAMHPVIRKLAQNREQQVRYLKRHLEFFNTHPYCASLILGVVSKAEEELVRNQEQDSDSPNRLKVGMMGPLAALGDTVFWAMLKPATALVGVSLVWLSPGGRVWPAVLGPLVFLFLFSIPHLLVSVGGVFLGYRHGLDIVKDLRRFNPQLIARRIGLFMAVGVGAAAALYIFQHSTAVATSAWLGAGILLGLLALLFAVLHRGVAVVYVFYGMVGLGIALAYAGLI
jgi:PTS system mannose-specific IID component